MITLERSQEIKKRLAAGESQRSIAKTMGISRGAVVRARVPERVRTREDFKPVPRIEPPHAVDTAACWSLENIRAARDAQMRGDFQQATRLAKAMRTDDALFIAYHNRIAPQNAIAARLEPASGVRGKNVARRAAASVIVPRETIAGIVGTLADHGIAVAYIEQETNEEGTRTDFRLIEWPLEFVKWNKSRRQLEARTRGGGLVDVIHGDGRWVEFRKFDLDPWTQEAAVLPGSMIYASHANAIADWNLGSLSHGQAKMVGELPPGAPPQNEDGLLSQDGQFMLDMMQALVSGEAGAGLMPAGSKLQFLANGSTAWQVFHELVQDRAKAAARIYLGTDAIMGSVGGAPGVDIAALFKMAATKLQGDFRAIEQGLRVGLYEPWTAINEGDTKLCPSLVYDLPDVDSTQNSENEGANMTRLLDTIERWRKMGIEVTQEKVNALARTFAVRDIPTLLPEVSASASAPLAPTDMARVTKVDEARAAGGLPALPPADSRGQMFLPQFEEALKAEAEAAKIKRQQEADAAKIAAQAQADAALAAAVPPVAAPAPAEPAAP
jgi:hypothetical protein